MPTYHHGMKKEDVVRMMLDNGHTQSQISTSTGLSPRVVSYYAGKLGLGRRRRRTHPLCPICMTRERDFGGAELVCRSPDCLGVYLSTFTCGMPRDEAERKVLLELYALNIPMDTFVICTRDDVPRLFKDKEDHVLYHAYCHRHAAGLHATRPPIPIWVDKDALKAQRDRLKEQAYMRKNRLSEYPQPRGY